MGDRRLIALPPKWLAPPLSGLLLALAFPSPDLHPLVWIALVPLLLAVRDARPARRAAYGLIAGFVWRAVSLYWITHVMVSHAGMAVPLGAVVTGLLAVWMALNMAVVCLLVPWAWRRGLFGALVFASAWVALEYLQTLLPFGFPWSLLGYAAGRSLLLMQAADLAGVWGLSLAAVFVNLAVAHVVAYPHRARRPAAAAATVLFGLATYGAARLAVAPSAEAVPAASSLRVATVQGNVEQGRVWAPDALRSILQKHVDLSLQGIDAGATLVFWSESSVPVRGGLQGDPSTRAMLAQLARQHDISLVVGSPYFEAGDGGSSWVTNAAFLVRADGSWATRYDKVHLVPWGEYVPLSWLFRFVTPLVEAIAGFRPGQRDQTLLTDPDAGVPQFAMAICYEVVFPDHVRRQVARGAQFVATITNDAWFGDTFAPPQHFSMARMRAVETRRYLVRAANTGISGVVDPWGRVLVRSALDEEALLTADIEPRTGRTLYVLWGDALARVCVLLSLLGVYGAWTDRAAPSRQRPTSSQTATT